jgi:DNA mismatch endonuclease, patch repair protein
MADMYSREKRSDIMSRIRSKGTKTEETLYRGVRAILGRRRRIDRNCAFLPGKPDLFIPSFGLAIFVDGCFYHGCPLHGHIPKSNAEYWAPKIERNMARDTSTRRKLRRIGYRVWRFWEHDLEGRKTERTIRLLEKRFSKIAKSSPFRAL